VKDQLSDELPFRRVPIKSLSASRKSIHNSGDNFSGVTGILTVTSVVPEPEPLYQTPLPVTKAKLTDFKATGAIPRIYAGFYESLKQCADDEAD